MNRIKVYIRFISLINSYILLKIARACIVHRRLVQHQNEEIAEALKTWYNEKVIPYNKRIEIKELTWEKQIDRMVYKLYDLGTKEIKIVEKNEN